MKYTHSRALLSSHRAVVPLFPERTLGEHSHCPDPALVQNRVRHDFVLVRTAHRGINLRCMTCAAGTTLDIQVTGSVRDAEARVRDRAVALVRMAYGHYWLGSGQPLPTIDWALLARCEAQARADADPVAALGRLAGGSGG